MRDARVIAAFDRAWQRILEHPEPRVCKHWCALVVVEEMEKLGISKAHIKQAAKAIDIESYL